MYTTLVLFTSEFPCGSGEPFLANEFNVLSKKFESVIILPAKYGPVTELELPLNTTVQNINAAPVTKSNAAVLLANLPMVLYVSLLELIHSKKKGVFLRHFREFNSYLLNCIKFSEQIAAFIEANKLQNTLYYSFWMNNPALSLAILKYKNKIGNFIFRANGFDLYDQQTKYNYIPYRPFIFKNAGKMFAVSKKGSDYMKAIGVNTKNITHSYFGTTDLGTSVFDPNAKFTIFTCSDLRAIKRTDLMVDILQHVHVPVKWVHHGDKGDAEKTFYEKIRRLPANVEFELHPRKENYRDVLQFIKTHHFNLFALLSRSEGIPVSLIEAISFGIPLIATDVGGVSEVVNDGNGILLEKEFDPRETAEKIMAFAAGAKNSAAFRAKVRASWEQRFSAKNNYELFYNDIIHSK